MRKDNYHQAIHTKIPDAMAIESTTDRSLRYILYIHYEDLQKDKIRYIWFNLRSRTVGLEMTGKAGWRDLITSYSTIKPDARMKQEAIKIFFQEAHGKPLY